MDKNNLKDRELRFFCFFTAALLFVAAFLFDTAEDVFSGFYTILTSRDILITDYFELAGFGAAFFNAGVMLVIAVGMVELSEIPFTGLTLMAIFMNVGFAFWGKNPVNILPILFGTWIHAKLHRQRFARYIYTGFFAACLAPFVSELCYILPFNVYVNVTLAVATGIMIGMITPAIASHTAAGHMGYSLFNVGFAGGIIAFVLHAILKAFGLPVNQVLIWKYGRHPGILIGLYIYFIIAIIYGIWLTGWKPSAIKGIFVHPGRAVADYVLMEGAGATLMSMGLLGIAAESYVLLAGGDLSGPILGGIITVFGVGAFGAHLRNYIPVLVGVWLSTFFTIHFYGSYAVIIAALFSVGLAPIAGQYGPIAGVVAGMLHSVVVMSTGALYGGLNLYNNGFSCGWVAIVMVPTMESFKQQLKLAGLIMAEKEEKEEKERQEAGEPKENTPAAKARNLRKRVRTWIMKRGK